MEPTIAAGLIGAGINAGSTALSGILTRKNNERVYDKQRSDALSDWHMQNAYNLEMYNLQNRDYQKMWHQQMDANKQIRDEQRQYDSPAEQMRRFKEAGINPYAMFGNMSGGPTMDAAQLQQASAPAPSSVRQTTMSPWQAPAPQFDLTQGIMATLGIQQQKAQINNLNRDIENKQIDAMLKLLDVTSKDLNNQRSKFDLDFLKDTRSGAIEVLEQSIRKARTENTALLDSNNRANELQPFNIQNIKQAISNAREDGKLKLSQQQMQSLDQVLKNYEINLNRQGLQKNDDLLYRLLYKYMSTPDPKSIPPLPPIRKPK